MSQQVALGRMSAVPCFVLLHANGMCKETLNPVSRLLRKKTGARVVSFDLLGHGKEPTMELPLPERKEWNKLSWEVMATDIVDRCLLFLLCVGLNVNPG